VGEASGGLHRLEEAVLAGGKALKDQKSRFKTLYRETKKLDLSADEIDALAAALLAKEQELAARWLPKIRSLGRDRSRKIG
jgi:hypothetical protein